MRAALALAAAATLLAVAGAGCGPRPADLFVVQRAGTIPAADLTLRVSDGGLVSCNGGSPRRLPDQLLLDARELTRQLTPLAKRRLRLAPGPGSVLSYRVQMPDGTIAFSDTSPSLPAPARRVQGLVRQVSKGVCGLPR